MEGLDMEPIDMGAVRVKVKLTNAGNHQVIDINA